MRVLLTLAAMLAIVAPAVAQTDKPDTEGGRYILREVDDQFLRVDRETGATSVCEADGSGWACRAVPDDRAALEAEITRLTEENADLARQVARLEDRLAQAGRGSGDDFRPAEPEKGRPTDPDAPKEEEDYSLDLPSDAEMDKIMETFEAMMRRFLGMVRSLKEDLERDPI